jgi:RNA polymerase sigma-70 factor (ECF subfamily)
VLSAASDRALAEALRTNHGAAKAELFDRYAPHTLRILTRVLGAQDADLSDLLHEVFLRALAGIADLRDPSALKGWLTGVAVLTARECIRKRSRRRWLSFRPFDELPEVESAAPGEDVIRALASTYAVLGELAADERIAFALRVIDGMELVDVAEACGVSLNTIKRRLARAEKRFVALARRNPLLREWLEGGARWTIE